MVWTNADGLRVKFGREEADKNIGGQSSIGGDLELLEFDIDYTELLSATAAVVGSVGAPGQGGLKIPEGARLVSMDLEVETAFTSSGTIGSATLVLGMKNASDYSTEYDHDGLTTTSATGTALGLATVGTVTTVKVGTTGAGNDWGTTLTDDVVLVAANSAHGSHPYTAGKLRGRLYYRVA